MGWFGGWWRRTAGRAWRKTAGWVVSAEVVETHMVDVECYGVEVVYEFVARRHIVRAGTVAFGDARTVYHSPLSAGPLAERYPHGQRLVVHYDPADPERAFVEPDEGRARMSALLVRALRLLPECAPSHCARR